MSTQTRITRDSLRDMLVTAAPEKRIHIVGRALVALFHRQTQSEKQTNDTHNWNAEGFSGADAKAGSLTAKSYLKRKTLEDWQVERWVRAQKNGYPRLCKYWKQLDEIAQAKAAAALAQQQGAQP